MPVWRQMFSSSQIYGIYSVYTIHCVIAKSNILQLGDASVCPRNHNKSQDAEQLAAYA